MSTTLFTGCSYTAGTGWANQELDSNLWTNILHSTNTHLCKTDQLNLGIPGGSNSEIFSATVKGLLEYRPKFSLVEWTSYPRYRVGLSVETYNAEQLFIANTKCNDHNLHSISYSESYLTGIRDRFISLHHPHLDIVSIIKYTNILINLAKTTGTQIFFINGLCTWDNEFFNKLSNLLPSEYTEYTQAILDARTRADSEVFQLYEKIHSEYESEGGVQPDYWLNLYGSMRSSLIDVNSDGVHPGKQSNILYSKIFNSSLGNKL